MIDFNDLQKPLVAALALSAAAAAGFAAGYMVGRDPEGARKIARTAASGLVRTRVALAEAMESLGDLWADARADAWREIEEERAAAAEAPVTSAQAPVPPAKVTGAASAARKAKSAKSPRARKSRRVAKRSPVATAA